MANDTIQKWTIKSPTLKEFVYEGKESSAKALSASVKGTYSLVGSTPAKTTSVVETPAKTTTSTTTYVDPKTGNTYPSKQWMIDNIKNLPEVQKAYPELMGGTTGTTTQKTTTQENNNNISLPASQVDTTSLSYKQSLADSANAEATKIFQEMEDKDLASVDTRESTKILNELKEQITKAETVEEPASLVEQYKEERANLGVDPLQDEYDSLQSEIDTINTTLLTEAAKAGEQLVSTREISRSKGKLQTEAESRIALLNVQKNAVATQLNNKLSTLETIMNLTQQDYASASEYYNNQIELKTSLYNVVNGIEEAEQTTEEKAKSSATANLTTLQNSLKNSGVTYDQLTDAQRLSIAKLEIQAGLPSGTTMLFMQNKPDADILTTSTSYDADGNQQTTIIYKDPKTGKVGAMEVVKTGGVKQETTKPTNSEIKDNIESQLKEKNAFGEDGKVAWETYLSMIKSWVNDGGTEKEFYINFPINQYLDSGNQKLYNSSINNESNPFG
jgi:hypothetical protein